MLERLDWWLAYVRSSLRFTWGTKVLKDAPFPSCRAIVNPIYGFVYQINISRED